MNEGNVQFVGNTLSETEGGKFGLGVYHVRVPCGDLVEKGTGGGAAHTHIGVDLIQTKGADVINVAFFVSFQIGQVLALPLVNVEAVRQRKFKVVVDAVNFGMFSSGCVKMVNK